MYRVPAEMMVAVVAGWWLYHVSPLLRTRELRCIVILPPPELARMYVPMY